MTHTGPTPERLSKAGRNVDPITDEHGWALTVRLDDSPIWYLYMQGQKRPHLGITGIQFQAGSKYYENAYIAGILGAGAPDMGKDVVDCSPKIEVSERRLEALQRHNTSLKALTHYSRHILSDVGLSETPLITYAERFRTFPHPRERRAIALQTLRNALDELVNHYGMRLKPVGPSYGHVEDYKPVIRLPDESATP